MGGKVLVCFLAYAYMLDPLAEQRNDMGVIHEVKNLFAVTPRLYQMHLAKTTHMVRYSRFSNTDQSGKLRHVHFLIDDDRQNADTARITECAE